MSDADSFSQALALGFVAGTVIGLVVLLYYFRTRGATERDCGYPSIRREIYIPLAPPPATTTRRTIALSVALETTRMPAPVAPLPLIAQARFAKTQLADGWVDIHIRWHSPNAMPDFTATGERAKRELAVFVLSMSTGLLVCAGQKKIANSLVKVAKQMGLLSPGFQTEQPPKGSEH